MFSASAGPTSVLDEETGFSRARTLLPRDAAPTAESSTGTGEADVFSEAISGRADPDFDPASTSPTPGPSQERSPSLEQAKARLCEARGFEVVAQRQWPARAPEHGEWPDWVDARVQQAFAQRGVTQPFVHQCQAWAALQRREHVVLSTGTASGKSLGYQVPILDAALRDPRATALMLFPTKALGRDQVEAFREVASPLGVGMGLYDGDTPPDERRATRRRAAVVATNPDMLHRGLLPNHDRWARVLSGLRYVVVDELHTYRGVFGSHVAHVLRRLLRLAAYHGASPQVVACSATIANPVELAETLAGCAPFAHVERDTSGAGAKNFWLVNPRVVDETTGVRRSYLKVAREVVSALDDGGLSTLAFCRSRKAVELLTRYLRERDAAADGDSPAARARAEKRIRGYRGGYLPERRREVEQALRVGEATVVATTNALELGIDVGGLDAVVLAGYPGTRAATWQRAGRAGRRTRESLTVCVLSSDPTDQFLGADPGFLFDATAEHARVDPLNPEILIPHLRCAAHELPMDPHEAWAPAEPQEVREVLDYLVDHGALHRGTSDEGLPRYYSSDGGYPADGVDLRGTIEENFSVLDTAKQPAEVVAEVDFEDGPLYLHPGAIYAVEGQTYEVRELDWDGRKAFVQPVDSPYYTDASSNERIRILEDEGPVAPHGVGACHWVRTVPGFKKLRFRTHENIGFGPISLPDLELHSVAAYWSAPRSVLEAFVDPWERSAAALGAAHAMHHVAVMLLMCDARDLGYAVTSGHARGTWADVVDLRRGASQTVKEQAQGSPCIHLYDRIPGGCGLAPQAHALGPGFFERVMDAVGGCGCADGCPTCTGPGADALDGARAGVLAYLQGLQQAARGEQPWVDC